MSLRLGDPSTLVLKGEIKILFFELCILKKYTDWYQRCYFCDWEIFDKKNIFSKLALIWEVRAVIWSFWEQDLRLYSYMVFWKSPLKRAGRVEFSTEKDTSDW